MQYGDLLERIISGLRPYEFRTLLLGFRRPADYERAAHEAIYRAAKVALGEELTRRLPGVDVDFLRPDIRIDIDERLHIVLKPAPLFIAGRYRKLSREIPASRWIHHACRGRGCPNCSHTGNLCGPSIEEMLASPVLELTGGRRVVFHALGREDTDARMLGGGRPFVLEVHAPFRRTIPLDHVADAFREIARERAEVLQLAPALHEDVAAVKRAAAEKTYRAWVRPDGNPPVDAATRARSLEGVTVEQTSPRRVMHRRGRDTCRRRRIISSSWAGAVEGRQVWEVRVESGTYVKELVSGDGGRTRPSLSEVLGLECRCDALDVLEVHWEPPWEARTESR